MIGSVFFVRNIELTESRYPLPHNKETKTRFPAYYQFYSDWHGGCRTYTTILWWWNAPVFRNLLLTTNVIGPVTTWRHHENWLTMIISFKNFTSWDEKHDDRKSESLKQCAKRMKIQAVINNKEKMTRHDEKGVKEWGNIKHWEKKNSGLHMVVTLKCLVEGKMTKYALIKNLKAIHTMEWGKGQFFTTLICKR